jgi:soluble lytic murein transglycosylase-like protein
MIRVSTIRVSMFSFGLLAAGLVPMSGAGANEAYSAMVARHAAAHGLPPSLVHRVIMRESRYNARAVSGGNYGIMQIRLGTARAMGYRGSAAGLLDPDTNMTYAVKYLAGAYRAAGGNADRAVALYASGYGGSGRAARSYARTESGIAWLSGAARRSRAEYVRARRGGTSSIRDHAIR